MSDITEDDRRDKLSDMEGLEILARDYESNLKRDLAFSAFEAMSYASILRQLLDLGDYEGAFSTTEKFKKSATETCRLMRRLDDHMRREGVK